jgi:hypothetical protein
MAMRALPGLFLLLLAAVSPDASERQVPSSVRIRIAAIDTVCYPNCAHPTEWKTTLVAELLDSAGGVIPPDAQALYEWGTDFCGGYGFGWGFAVGTGLWSLDVDGNKIKTVEGCCPACPYQAYLIAVRVRFGDTFVTSQIIRVPDGGTQWAGAHAGLAPNPFDLSGSHVLTLSVPVEEPTVQVSILSPSGNLAFRREYTAVESFGRRIVQIRSTDFANHVTSGVYFVVVKTSVDQFVMKVSFIRH